MRKFVRGKTILTFIFLVLLMMIFILNLNSVLSIAKSEIKAIVSTDRNEFMMPNEIEAAYDDSFYGKLDYIDINGFVHKVMGQKLVNGAIKGNDNKLFLETDSEYVFDEEREKSLAEKAVSILDYAKGQGSEVLYVQRPMKFIEGKDSLPYGMDVEYNDQYDLWCDVFAENDIDVLDLRESLGNKLEFYKTDHHWTVESSFYSARAIVDRLAADYGLDFDRSKFDESNYYSDGYPNSFLGSEGVKAGRFYVGKDDFNFLIPEFDTSFRYEHYIEGDLDKIKEGDFQRAFIDTDILEDKDYNNKYNACLYGGYVENVIVNNDFTSGKKLLLISDSYARPMVQYLSMAFSEIRYLDPQDGRYNDSYIEYIKEYDPDYVVMMYTGEFVEV